MTDYKSVLFEQRCKDILKNAKKRNTELFCAQMINVSNKDCFGKLYKRNKAGAKRC